MIVRWGPLMPHIIHDVRALARKCTSSSQLLERKLGADADPEVATWLSSIVAAQRDLNLFMVRLGTLAQADQPASGPEPLLDLDAALIAAKLHCRELLVQSNAEFSIGPLPECKIPVRLEIVWTELISNACRFRHPGRPLTIRIEASQHDDSVCVQVSDNGSGWNPVFAEMLFEPLQRLDPQKGGFGLGLAISRAAVESVGGQIHGELGSPGACFQVSIPVVPDGQVSSVTP
jgi:signal transduction histidine kinase